MDIFPATLYQAALADFLVDGHYARHLRRMRALYRERRGALVEALRAELPTAEILGAQAGMHLCATLPRIRDQPVARRAAALGVWALPLSSCYLGAPARQGFVLGFAGARAQEMAPAARRLRAAIK
jgi:GntR family transcriptional regulator/MocR family aminotransferase